MPEIVLSPHSLVLGILLPADAPPLDEPPPECEPALAHREHLAAWRAQGGSVLRYDCGRCLRTVDTPRDALQSEQFEMCPTCGHLNRVIAPSSLAPQP